MVRINGTLVVKEIKGANGKFCVGDLTTSLGDFKVKEPILDQFEEGRYEGEFVIERVFLNSYVWRGKSTTDIRARVTEIYLDTVDEGAVEEIPTEPDPMTTDVATSRTVTSSVESAPEPAPVLNTDEQDPARRALDELFGQDIAALVADTREVKLDPTVDRAKFRVQRDRLKELGYRFDAKSQIWVPSEAA